MSFDYELRLFCSFKWQKDAESFLSEKQQKTAVVGPELCDFRHSRRKRRQFGLKSIFRPCIYHEWFFLGVWGFFWLVFHTALFRVCLEKVLPRSFALSSLDVCSLSISDVDNPRGLGMLDVAFDPDLRAASPWSWWQVRRENHGSWGPIHRSLWFCVPRFIEVPRFIKVDSFPVQIVAEIEVCFPAWSSRNSNFGSWTPESAMAIGSW